MLEDANVVTVIPTIDPIRARAFYHDVLGIPIEQEFNTSTIYVTTAGSKIYTYKSQHPSKHTVASFVVADIRKLLSSLKDKGVLLDSSAEVAESKDGIYDMGDSWVTWFKDSEGNTLEVSQIKS